MKEEDLLNYIENNIHKAEFDGSITNSPFASGSIYYYIIRDNDTKVKIELGGRGPYVIRNVSVYKKGTFFYHAVLHWQPKYSRGESPYKRLIDIIENEEIRRTNSSINNAMSQIG